jgi:hypothetical protein
LGDGPPYRHGRIEIFVLSDLSDPKLYNENKPQGL